MQTTLERSAASWVVLAVLSPATTLVDSLSWTQLTAYPPELHVPAGHVPGWISAMSSLGWIFALPLAPLWACWLTATAASW